MFGVSIVFLHPIQILQFTEIGNTFCAESVHALQNIRVCHSAKRNYINIDRQIRAGNISVTHAIK